MVGRILKTTGRALFVASLGAATIAGLAAGTMSAVDGPGPR